MNVEQLKKEKMDIAIQNYIDGVNEMYRKIDIPEITEISEGDLAGLEDQYKEENFANHTGYSGLLPYNTKDMCEDMRGLEVEKKRVLMFNIKNEYIGYEEVTGSPWTVGLHNTRKLIKRVIANEECASVVVVHNHPNFAAAIPSKPDKKARQKEKDIYDFLGILHVDDCIISEMDFYSWVEDEGIQ